MPRLSNAFRILVAISIEIVRAPSVSKRFTDEKDTFAALAKSRADLLAWPERHEFALAMVRRTYVSQMHSTRNGRLSK